MADYSKSCIYMIKTGNDTYIGSTSDFKRRFRDHNTNIYSDRMKDNIKLYRTIRENDKKWEIIKLHDFPCDNDTELKIEEKRVYDALQPTLNERKPYQTAEELIQHTKTYNKNYKQKNKEHLITTQKIRVICECGKEVNKYHIARHRKSKKHIELMG